MLYLSVSLPSATFTPVENVSLCRILSLVGVSSIPAANHYALPPSLAYLPYFFLFLFTNMAPDVGTSPPFTCDVRELLISPGLNPFILPSLPYSDGRSEQRDSHDILNDSWLLVSSSCNSQSIQHLQASFTIFYGSHSALEGLGMLQSLLHRMRSSYSKIEF